MNEQHLESALAAALHKVAGNNLLMSGFLTTLVILIAVMIARYLLIQQVKAAARF